MCCNPYWVSSQRRSSSQRYCRRFITFMEFSSKKSTSSTKFEIPKRKVSSNQIHQICLLSICAAVNERKAEWNSKLKYSRCIFILVKNTNNATDACFFQLFITEKRRWFSRVTLAILSKCNDIKTLKVILCCWHIALYGDVCRWHQRQTWRYKTRDSGWNGRNESYSKSCSYFSFSRYSIYFRCWLCWWSI